MKTVIVTQSKVAATLTLSLLAVEGSDVQMFNYSGLGPATPISRISIRQCRAPKMLSQ